MKRGVGQWQTRGGESKRRMEGGGKGASAWTKEKKKGVGERERGGEEVTKGG